MPTPGSPSGARTTNTMAEGLTGLLQQVAYLQTLPDADLHQLSGLQMTLLGMIRAPMQQAMQQAQMAGGAPPLGSAQPFGSQPGPMGGAPMGGAEGGQVPPGLRNGIALPPVDELRRLVNGAGQ